MESWKSRIVGHDKVDPESLTGNPKNHRRHPEFQRQVVHDSIAELGFVKSVIVNKQTGFILDGHERVWQALEAKNDDPNLLIDVEFVDLTEAEEAKALAILDASSELAYIDADQLMQLVAEVDSESESIDKLIEQLQSKAGVFEVEGGEFPELSAGDREGTQQMTFILSDDQVEIVKQALSDAKAAGDFDDPANDNANGNALARIAEAYQNGSSKAD